MLADAWLVAAKDLRLAAEILTESPVSYVFNSHYHNDHMRGNQEFSDAQIISTDKTLDLIETAGMAELESDKEASQQYRRYLAEWKNTTDQTAREKSRFWLDYYRVLADSLDGLRLCLPQITFNQQLTISGSARSVHLLTYGGGHTGSDGFLYIPDAGVLFLSDLLFVRCHPFLADGHPENWIAILEKIQTLEADVLVPGHFLHPSTAGRWTRFSWSTWDSCHAGRTKRANYKQPQIKRNSQTTPATTKPESAR